MITILAFFVVFSIGHELDKNICNEQEHKKEQVNENQS